MSEVYEKLCDIDSAVNDMLCDVINEREGVRKGTKLEAWLDSQYLEVDILRQKIWGLMELVKEE